jgi:hypothetical protein
MKRLLTIGQVAARLGRSVDFVRQRTDDGQLRAEPRGKGKYRHYTEAAVAAYEANEQRHRPMPQRRPRPKRASPPPLPPRRVTPVVDPEPLPDDEVPWDDQFEVEPPPPPSLRTSSPAERLYLDILITGGMLHAPWGLPEDWRGKLQADLEQYVTIERFSMRESVLSAPTTIRHHVEAFLAPYQEAKKKEEERQRAREAAARAAEERRCALISYGRQLLENALASWASDDPKDEARREVELVLQAEVRPDGDEQKVRELVTKLLDQYEEDDDGTMKKVDDDDDGKRQFDD